MNRFTKYALAWALAVCLLSAPLAVFATTAGAACESSAYTYDLPSEIPAHSYYDEAFSTSQEFRNIFIAQYGSDKAIVYDLVAHVMIKMLYDDNLDYGKEIHVSGFEAIADVVEINSAHIAVCKDMPFLHNFIFFRAGGSGYDYDCVLSREVTNYFSDDAPTTNAQYIATRDSVIDELLYYRSAVSGIADDEEKLEIVGQLFDAGSVYDKSAPYHGIPALLAKRGVCGGSSLAFVLVGNAVDVPSYYLHVAGANHAVTLVKPNGGEVKVIDVTFGKRKPKVENISSWKYRKKVNWEQAFGFNEEYYFPAVNIFGQLGGLS